MARRPREVEPKKINRGQRSSEHAFRRIAEEMRAKFAEIDAITSVVAELFVQIPWTVRRARSLELSRVGYLLNYAAELVCAASYESERQLRVAVKSRKR